MQVRLKTGLKAGTVIEADDQVAYAWLVSGKAERAEPEAIEASDVVESPERPKRRRRSTPETR